MIGIDEVGRGCWAGPLLVVAARGKTDLPRGLTDSKIMSKKQREQMFPLIAATCQIGEGWVSAQEIDEHGLGGAMRLGVDRALRALEVLSHEPIIMDGPINYCSPRYGQVTCVIGGDALHPIVSAASIYAKVSRDRYMADAALQYPGYGFERHAGYGTAFHREQLIKYGACGIHRKSFRPVREAN